jgi:hypothetical protein
MPLSARRLESDRGGAGGAQILKIARNATKKRRPRRRAALNFRSSIWILSDFLSFERKAL